MGEFDLEMVNPELADVVLDVAEECDSRYCDRMVIKIPPIKIKLVIDGHEIEISNAGELEREEKERDELKKKIKQLINNDATTGYIKAYELCGDIDNELTRKIRYRTYENIPYLLYQQKIDICKKYAEIKKDDATNIFEQIANLQYEMVKNTECIEALEVFQTLKKAYELSGEKYHKNRMMWCYNNKKEKDGVIYWEKIFLPVFENEYNDNIGFWGEIIFDILITKKEFDEAGKFLDIWEQNELRTTPPEDIIFNLELSFIESNKQRLIFLRKGYHFWDSYTEVICYDDLTITGSKEEVALIKNKYKEAISKFRECLTLIQVSKSETKNDDYINACEEEIAIIPSILAYTNEMSRHASYKDPWGQTMGYGVFKELSIYYQKQNRISDAIRVCEKGIECGYIDDGTKSGMYGRLERLLKKAEK